MLLPPESWKFTVDSTPSGMSPLNATVLVLLTAVAATSMSMPRSRFVGPIW